MIALVMAAAAAPTLAATRVSVDIPAGMLGDAVIRLAQAANVTIGLTDPTLVRLPTSALRGTLAVDEALARLTRKLPAHAEQIDTTTWRIVANKPAGAPETRTEKSATPATGSGDVIVTGSKTGTRFDRYAGTATILSGSDMTLGERGAGSDALVQRMPTFGSTHLAGGPHRCVGEPGIRWNHDRAWRRRL
jgi:iron complex outermembrane recepter protein